MWFSPGIVLAGIIVLIVYEVTGRADQWWLWLGAVIIAIILDAILGWKPRTVIKHRTTTEYHKE